MSKSKRPIIKDNDFKDLREIDSVDTFDKPTSSFSVSPLTTPTPTPHCEAPPSPRGDTLAGYVLNKALLKDSMGRYRVMSLFVGEKALFTLDDYSNAVAPSFKRLYVEIGDPSEYDVAILLLGSWEHWTRLVESVWFKPYLNEAREELNAKIRSQAVKQIQNDGKVAFSEATRLAANKFLATGGYLQEAEKEVVKEVAKRGRPSKEEIARRTKEILTEEGTINADYARMQIKGIPIGTA